ncbi:MAG: ATP-binding cassette domain-containing protein [Betaproteobacteria bacterium]|nr:ATP-binding cassette domain-containing protein [Betaproteobacteria bacterium]MBI2960911.1 ATP-binding cassette domain-containing protein [Betaproteobacteria bacterium]
MTRAAPVIEVHGLWTQYGEHVVHRDLDLSVQSGEVVSLVGGSGSGKTTLMRQMLGLESPARGSVNVFGIPLHGSPADTLKKIRRRWGVLFQEGALYSALSVFDNIALPLRELRVFEEGFIHDMVMLKLDMVDIERRHATKMPADLSGGMVKRIALARALALEPELVFLDEPTAGLDPDRSESFVRLIQALHEQLRLTVVMVTHDLDTLVSLSDRIAVLAEQRVIVCGSLAEVVRIEHPFIRNFFLGERGVRALAAARAELGVRELWSS